jgi:NDP-4-keto-2,6-dideoxyhexose 3-C-methyltransferase
MVTRPVYRRIGICRVCRSAELREVLSLGEQALGGRFPRNGESDPPRAPLDLVRCDACGLVQLRHTVDAQAMFTDHYGYRSGINQTMRQHLASIAHQVMSCLELTEGDVVLDIGCNDGTLLRQYPDTLIRIGIDPLVEKFQAYLGDFQLVSGFFTADRFRSVAGHRHARAVTSIAVFYDLDDPNAFVADVAAILDPAGIWVLEQSYMPLMLQQNSYDTICHEHLEYYSLAQIEPLMKAHRLRVFDCELNDCNGGSFRLFVCHERAVWSTNHSRLAELRRRESELGLDGIAPLTSFRNRCHELRSQLREFVETEVGRGRVFHLYGASTKGNTILQFCELDHRWIAGAADRNPEKWGARTPATNIPILSEADSRRARPDYFLVLPWHFREEFLRREAQFRATGGKLVFPLPKLNVV